MGEANVPGNQGNSLTENIEPMNEENTSSTTQPTEAYTDGTANAETDDTAKAETDDTGKAKTDIQLEEEKTVPAVCQDFIRGVCFRTSCKFKHVIDETVEKVYIFCKNYQKGRCTRENCRFIHCSPKDELHYTKTGELLPRVQASFLKTKLNMYNNIEDAANVCRDFIRGKCNRENCKYIHEDRNNPKSLGKRKRGRSNDRDGMGSWYQYQDETDMLRDHNERLMCRVDDLLKRVDTLQATNDYLLEQNSELRARLRSGKKVI